MIKSHDKINLYILKLIDNLIINDEGPHQQAIIIIQ
jgi:hypothetical protein